MKVLARRFNIYLALAFLLGLVCGCQTANQEKKVGALRVHIEVSPDPAGTSQTISVLRSDPVLVTIKREPILTEANIVAAKVIDARGGFAIEIKFDENGTWLLEQYSAANPGRHFVIFGQWGEKLAGWPLARRAAHHPPHQRRRAGVHARLLARGGRSTWCSASTTSRRKSKKNAKMIFPAVRRAIFFRRRVVPGIGRQPFRATAVSISHRQSRLV
jgi:hypothetical protein